MKQTSEMTNEELAIWLDRSSTETGISGWNGGRPNFSLEIRQEAAKRLREMNNFIDKLQC